MSDSSLAMRLAGRAGIDPQLREVEDDACEDLGCFGFLRGVRERAVMLELRKKNGNILAIGYSWIERMEFDPSVGIVLHAAGQKILIEGRNLNGPEGGRAKLFEALTWQRVPWIRELPGGDQLRLGAEVCCVKAIRW